MKSTRLSILSLVAAFGVCACGGGAGSTPRATPAGVAGKFVLTIPTATSTPASRTPKYVSPSAVSLSISTNAGPPTIVDITNSSPYCTQTQTGRVCTIPLTAPAGSDTFTIRQYDGANATGHLLGTGTAVVAVTLGTPFVVSAVLGGNIASIALALGTIPAAGTSGTTSLTVLAYDADANLIIGPGSYNNPVTLSLVDPSGQTTLSTTNVTSPSQSVVTITYAGGLGTSATITAAALGSTSASALFAPAANTLNLYAAEYGNSSLTVTPLGGTGNAAASHTISGTLTSLNKPDGIAVDASGFVYASDEVDNSVTVYAPGANGNVLPVRVLSGTNTGLHYPEGLAIDAAGELVVSNLLAQTITVYAPGAAGNATPIRTISGSATQLADPWGITLDAAGNLYVVDSVNLEGTGNDEVTVYPPGANGNVAPTRMITGSATGLSGAVYDAVDASGTLYVVNNIAKSVTAYAPGANGNAAPIVTIIGGNTTFSNPFGIAIDGTGTLYVSNGAFDSIAVFAQGANGNVAPIRIITGPGTGLDVPTQLTIAP